MTLDFPWWLTVVLYLILIAMYFGIGATFGFLFTYRTLRTAGKAEGEVGHRRSTALGLSTFGALAGGALNFLLVWLVAAA